MNDNSFDHDQYRKDAEVSYQYPLPQQVIPIGKGIDVYGLPDFRTKTGRYLLSQTNAEQTVGKSGNYILRFTTSDALSALPWKGFEFSTFKVEKSRKPVLGIPLDLATAFWGEQANKGNKKAIALAVALMTTSLERQADIAFGVNRTAEEEVKRLQDLLFRLEAGDYSIHFCKDYYKELHRILPFVSKPKNGRPPLFAKITREYFYNLFPGRANDIFDERNPNRWHYNHQLLSETGDKVFEQVMISFLTFLRCSRPGNWGNFVTQYQNAYGDGYQNDLGLD